MASLNKVMLIGNLGKDPEVKYSPSGIQIARFSLATSEKYKKGDVWEEKTEWHNIVLFGKQADFAGEYLKKGTTVYLEGKITNRSWEDDKGIKKYMTEIICSIIQILSKRETPYTQTENKTNDNVAEASVDTEDDLPF